MADDQLLQRIASLKAQNDQLAGSAAAGATTAAAAAVAAANATSTTWSSSSSSSSSSTSTSSGGGGGSGGSSDGAHPKPQKRGPTEVRGRGSPIKRIRSASDAFRHSNPFKRFARAGLLPFVPRQYINGGSSEVKPYADPDTGAPTPFNKASQKKLSEFREYHQKHAKHMVIPSFLRRHAARFVVKIGDLTLVMQEVLGSGGFGLVFRAHLVEADVDVAVKFLLSRVGASSPEFTKARKLPARLFQSDTIVQYLALCERTQFSNASAELIIMELADGGDLAQAIVKPGDDMQLTPIPMTAKHARLVIIQIIRGLQNLYRNNHLHRDLKAENLWFTRDGRLVLGDLGCIKDIEGKSPMGEQTVVGTEFADAPELSAARKHHQGNQYRYDSEKTDVWAVGFIYFQLRSGLHLRENDVLKFEGREHEVFTPKTATARANDLFWATWEKWQRNIQPGGKYEKLEWTKAYRTEPFSDAERDFLDAILVLEPAHRPKIYDLGAAVKGGREAKPALRWLGPQFCSARDAADFEQEMRTRITNFAAGKNVITYPFKVEADGRVSQEEVMRQTYNTLAEKIQVAAKKLHYDLRIGTLIHTPAVIQSMFDFYATAPHGSGGSGGGGGGVLSPSLSSSAGPSPPSVGSPPLGQSSPPSGQEPVLRVIVEVEQPNDEMNGLCVRYSFEPRKGDSHIFKGFMRRLRREMKKG